MHLCMKCIAREVLVPMKNGPGVGVSDPVWQARSAAALADKRLLCTAADGIKMTQEGPRQVYC